MHYDIGDLVSYATRFDFVGDTSPYGIRKVGIIVDIKNANDGMNNSEHTRHLSNIIRDVYYVLIPDIGKIGPYYASELHLEQKGQGNHPNI